MSGRRQAVTADLVWSGGRWLRDATVTIGPDGRIEAVEQKTAKTAQTAPPAEPTRRLGRRALLPGFVNAHSHAFQRGLRGRGERFPAGAGSFWTWREAMYELVAALDRDAFYRLTVQAFAEMRDAGVTTVGEFHYLHHLDPAGDGLDFALDDAVLEAAAAVGIRLVLLEAHYATGGIGQPLEGAQRRFATRDPDVYWRQMDRLAGRLDPATQSLGVVAHSVRAAPPDDIARLHAEAVRRDLPFHMHLEEQRREIEETEAAYGLRPLELVADRLELSPRFTAVHATHTTANDLARLGAAGGHVCICPTTEANLGDGIADLPAMRDADVGVCLGTDSNARISMLEEARWLELVQRLARERRGVAIDDAGRVGPVLLEAATHAGARSLGLASDAGEIRPGARADLVAIDLDSPDLAGWDQESLLDALFLGAGGRAVAATCVGGRWRDTGAEIDPDR